MRVLRGLCYGSILFWVTVLSFAGGVTIGEKLFKE